MTFLLPLGEPVRVVPDPDPHVRLEDAERQQSRVFGVIDPDAGDGHARPVRGEQRIEPFSGRSRTHADHREIVSERRIRAAPPTVRPAITTEPFFRRPS